MQPHLVTPLAFLIRSNGELAKSILSLYVTGLKVEASPYPFCHGLSDPAIRSSLSQLIEWWKAIISWEVADFNVNQGRRAAFSSRYSEFGKKIKKMVGGWYNPSLESLGHALCSTAQKISISCFKGFAGRFLTKIYNANRKYQRKLKPDYSSRAVGQRPLLLKCHPQLISASGPLRGATKRLRYSELNLNTCRQIEQRRPKRAMTKYL